MIDFKPHESPVHEAKALPTILPGKLVGRDASLAQVYAHLKANNPVLLHGPSGVGKTAVAATLASAYAQQPGGVLWMNVQNPRLEELLVRVGRAYQIDEIVNSENPLGMIGAVENTLRSNKPLVIIDGAVQEGVISRFISRCSSNLPLIVLSEVNLEGPWASLELSLLDTDQSVALFKQESRTATDEHDAHIRNLVGIIGGLPLAIVVTARAMIASKKTPAEFVNIVQQIANAVGGNGTEAAITTSFRTLTGALQGVLLMMGATFNGRVSSELLSMISGAPADSIVQAMNILAQLNLIGRTRRYNDHYYMLHPVIQTFTQESLRKSNRLEELQTKVVSAVLSYARKYSGTTQEAHDKLATEMDMFVEMARWAAANGRREVVIELVNAVTNAGNFVSERGYLFEQLELRAIATGGAAFPAHGTDESAVAPEDMLDFDEYEDDDDEYDEFDDDEFELDDEALEEVDDLPVTPAEVDLETADLGQLRTELAQAKQDDDLDRQKEVLKHIGQQQIDLDMENEAISTYTELLDLQEEEGEGDDVLDTLDMLSALMAKTENSQAAVMHATRGIKLADELDNKDAKMHLLKTLADARQQVGESDQAVQDYLAALEIARMTDDTQNEAIILYKLGYAQLDDGDSQAAVDTWEKALALFKSQDKRDYEGRTLGGLGSAYGDMGRWAEAVNFHTSALYIARETDDKEEEALQLSSLAYAASQANQLGEAVLRYRQALHLAYESEDRDNIVSLIVDLSRLLLQSRKHVSIAELLVNDALRLESTDRDVTTLKARVDSEKMLAESYGTEMIPVTGTARDYAENAYRLLDA